MEIGVDGTVGWASAGAKVGMQRRSQVSTADACAERAAGRAASPIQTVQPPKCSRRAPAAPQPLRAPPLLASRTLISWVWFSGPKSSFEMPEMPTSSATLTGGSGGGGAGGEGGGTGGLGDGGGLGLGGAGEGGRGEGGGWGLGGEGEGGGLGGLGGRGGEGEGGGGLGRSSMFRTPYTRPRDASSGVALRRLATELNSIHSPWGTGGSRRGCRGRAGSGG